MRKKKENKDKKEVPEKKKVTKKNQPYDKPVCSVCGQIMCFEYGFAGTRLCGPCATGEGESINEFGDTW